LRRLDCQFSPDEKGIYTVIATTIKIGKAENGQFESQVKDHSGAITTIACFSADNKFIFSETSDNTIKKWVIGYDKTASIMGCTRFHVEVYWYNMICVRQFG